MTENPGGVESFLMNYYRNIDRNKIQFDFLCNSHNMVAYEEELLALGGRTYHITARSRNPVLYKKELEQVFYAHARDWSAVWVNVSSLANIDYLKTAQKYGIKIRIIHSHNSCNMDNKLRGILHEWNKRTLEKRATDFWACSYDAARWFYKEELMPEVKIIHNAIDVDRMDFDEQKRKEIRRKIGADDSSYVIGNAGRLHFQKNQSFAIDVFREYLKINSDALLVLVGQGEDENALRERSEDIKDKVIFAGIQTDMQAWLSSFDLFLFPSLFEGLSVSAMEAQANGLPVLASEKVIPEEVKIASNFLFFSLEASSKSWADQIEVMRTAFSRNSFTNVRSEFRERGFDISIEAGKLEGMLYEAISD